MSRKRNQRSKNRSRVKSYSEQEALVLEYLSENYSPGEQIVQSQMELLELSRALSLPERAVKKILSQNELLALPDPHRKIPRVDSIFGSGASQIRSRSERNITPGREL